MKKILKYLTEELPQPRYSIWLCDVIIAITIIQWILK